MTEQTQTHETRVFCFARGRITGALTAYFIRACVTVFSVLNHAPRPFRIAPATWACLTSHQTSHHISNISVSLTFPVWGRARLAPGQSGGRPAPAHAPAPVPVRAARVVMICQLSGSRVAVGAPAPPLPRCHVPVPTAHSTLVPLPTPPQARLGLAACPNGSEEVHDTNTAAPLCTPQEAGRAAPRTRAPALTSRRELTWYYIGLYMYIGLTKCLPRPSRVSLCQQGAGKMSSHGCEKFPDE